VPFEGLKQTGGQRAKERVAVANADFDVKVSDNEARVKLFISQRLTADEKRIGFLRRPRESFCAS
jgi:hypothetical protein